MYIQKMLCSVGGMGKECWVRCEGKCLYVREYGDILGNVWLLV